MVTFDINGAIIEFDEQRDNYNKIRKDLKLKAIELCDEFEKRCNDNIQSLKQLSDNGLSYGLECIEEAIKKGVETMIRYDLITVDTAIFKETYCKKYLNYERLFNNLNKQTLSPKRNKKGSYNNSSSLQPLIKQLSGYLYTDCFNIHFAVIDALIENGVDKVKCYIDSDSKQKSTALFNNYKDGFISKKDESKVIKQIIDLNPYRKDIYEYLIKEDGDILKDIEKLTSYLGYDVSDYKDELMNIYIEKLMKEDKSNLEFLKERIIKYARYIGSSKESIYIARIDAIYTFQTA